MPLSKKLSAYPFEFENLARSLAALRNRQQLILPSYKAAVKFRQQVYGFAGALEHFAEKQEKIQPRLAADRRALADAIRQVEIRLKDNVLTFVPRCDTETYHAIQSLINQLQDTPENQATFLMEERERQEEEERRQKFDQDKTLRRLGYSTGIGEKECTEEEKKQEAPAIDLNEFVEETSKTNQAYKEFMARTSNNNTDKEDT